MKTFDQLVTSLDQLVTVYRHLLDIVRKENEVLAKVDTSEVPQINEAKEKLVAKVRALDIQWQEAAEEMAKELGLTQPEPTLLELAKPLEGERATKLENLHSVLTMLVQRISEFNKKNAVLVQAALSHITGAMDCITKTLNENPTYKQSGNMEADNKDAQGRIMHREA